MSEHIYEDSDMENERYHIIPFGWQREEITRCRDCKHNARGICKVWDYCDIPDLDNGFCKWGEKEE